jgi:AhpD family alkylhydroperoxidase
MKQRLNPYKSAPELYPAMKALQEVVDQTGLEASLRELVAIRASQLNGCAFCLDFHAKRALAAGEPPERLVMLDAWRESTLFSPREKAALAWCEAATDLARKPVHDHVYDEARLQFSESELARLTLAIVVINGWNRINVPFQVPAGALG